MIPKGILGVREEGFMFSDLHVSLNLPFIVGGLWYKFDKFVFFSILNGHLFIFACNFQIGLLI